MPTGPAGRSGHMKLDKHLGMYLLASSFKCNCFGPSCHLLHAIHPRLSRKKPRVTDSHLLVVKTRRYLLLLHPAPLPLPTKQIYSLFVEARATGYVTLHPTSEASFPALYKQNVLTELDEPGRSHDHPGTPVYPWRAPALGELFLTPSAEGRREYRTPELP